MGNKHDHKPGTFLSTLSLRRATLHVNRTTKAVVISIHALLAESDAVQVVVVVVDALFLSTLSLRRATRVCQGDKFLHSNFYPRSPCGERQAADISTKREASISIHALLAESDVAALLAAGGTRYFYPRSPCGERPHYDNYNLHCVEISIHALLAESDPGQSGG